MSFRERQLVQKWLANHAGKASNDAGRSPTTNAGHRAGNIQFVALRMSPRVGYMAAVVKGADFRLDACDEDVVMAGAEVVADESLAEDVARLLEAPDAGMAGVLSTSRMEMATVLPDAESMTTVAGGPTKVRVSKAEPQGSTTWTSEMVCTTWVMSDVSVPLMPSTAVPLSSARRANR